LKGALLEILLHLSTTVCSDWQTTMFILKLQYPRNIFQINKKEKLENFFLLYDYTSE